MFSILFQVYTGPYKTKEHLENGVKLVDDFLIALRPGVMVAVKLEDSRTYPVIGNVVSVCKEENTFEINYWIGSYNKPWKVHYVNSKPWSDTLPFSCLLLVDFKLNDNMLTKEQRKYLKECKQ